MTRSHLAAFGFVAATALTGIGAYFALPRKACFAVHFTADGRPDGFTDKLHGLFTMPVIAVVVVALIALFPRVAIYRKGLDASSPAFGAVLSGVAAVLFAAQAAIIAHAFDPNFDVLRAVFVAVGALLVVVGNMLGKLRHNYAFGVRTPWTLRDATVWDKTHRFTGRLMVVTGVALIPIAIFTPDHRWLIALMITCAAGPAIAGAVYSALISPKPNLA